MSSSELNKPQVGIRTSDLSAERLKFLKQIGVTDVVVDPIKVPVDVLSLRITTDSVPSVKTLQAVKDRLESFDLRFHAVHTLPIASFEEALFGTDKADEQIENIAMLVRNLGEVGVPVLGYKWAAKDVGRTAAVDVRGSAVSTSFDESASDAVAASSCEYSEDDHWENYRRFVEKVVPVAEEADVKLAVHPADPPVYEELHGIPSLFRSVETFERAMEMDPSPYHGIKLCLGCFSEMGEDIVKVIRTFGEQDKIVLVHFRDVVGTTPTFHETWIDDPESHFDELDAMRALHKVGYRGVLLGDHVPQVEGDEPWDTHMTGDATPFDKGGPRARAYTVGYLNGLVRSLE